MLYSLSRIALTFCSWQLATRRSKSAFEPAWAWFGGAVLWLDDCRAVPAGSRRQATLGAETLASHRAYVLFTSGSTGKPKGVGVPHVGVVNYVTNSGREGSAVVEAPSRMCFTTNYTFDVHVVETLAVLVRGWTIVVSESIIDLPGAPFDLMSGTPSAFSVMEVPEQVKYVCNFCTGHNIA